MENGIQRLVPPHNLWAVSFISTFIVTPIAIEQINILFKPDPTRSKLKQIRYCVLAILFFLTIINLDVGQ